MKKIICLVLVFTMMLTACSNLKVEIRNPEEQTENLSSEVSSEAEKPESKPEEQPETSKPEEEKGEPPVSGDYLLLETNGDAIYEVLEFDDQFVVYYVTGNIAAFDKESGEKIYEYSLGDVNAIRAFDMMKTDSRAGFDFSVSMEDKVVYLSSESPELIDEVFLPKNIMNSISGDLEDYSVYGEKIVWISEEGIRMGNLDGTDEKIIIPTADIENKIKPVAEKAYDELYLADDGEPCIFYEVSFICGGEKVAVTVTSDRTFLYWAAALYDIESEEFEWAYTFNEMVNAEYPFADKYIAVGKKWINAETGNYKNFGIWTRTANGTDFFHTGWQTVGFELYYGDFENIEENGKLLLKTEGESAAAYIESITENYVVVHVYDGENEWDCVVKYK